MHCKLIVLIFIWKLGLTGNVGNPLVCIINFPALDEEDSCTSASIQEPSPSKSSGTVGETASANVTSRTSTPPKLEHKEAMNLLEEYFPEAFSGKTCTVITPVQARVQSFPNKSNKSNKEKVTNSSTNGYSMKPSRFQGKQGCGGLFSLKGRGCTAFFVAYITQRTDTTKIASLTVSHPFAIRDQLSSTPRLMGTL